MKRTFMRLAGRIALALLSAVLIGAAAGYFGYQVGGRVGYLFGFADGSVVASATESALSSAALRALRAGDTENGMSLLEQSVDSGLMAYWGYLQRGESEFDRQGLVAKSHQVMRRVAEYRELHPPVSQDEGVLQAINDTLAYIDAGR